MNREMEQDEDFVLDTMRALLGPGMKERWRLLDETDDGEYEVSTVELPFAHPRGTEMDAMYETMVFRVGDRTDIDMDRYVTQEEAEAGHARMLAKWNGGEA